MPRREPQENQINALGTAATSKLSAISTIKSGLSNLQTALAALVKSADNPGYKTTLGTDVTFTAAVDTGDNATSPVAGTHQVQVRQLAQNQKLSSKAFDKDAAIGGGKLTIGYGDTSLDVDIAADSKLADVAKAINKPPAAGVVASVVTADDGQHLVLTAVDSGEAGAITVTRPAATAPWMTWLTTAPPPRRWK